MLMKTFQTLRFPSDLDIKLDVSATVDSLLF